MEIKIKRLNNATHFEAENPTGQSIQFDGGKSMGGIGAGMSPMEVLLSSVAACSAMDVVDILGKQKEPLEDLQIDVRGDRYEDVIPKPFKAIHIRFNLFGDVKEAKAARAVSLAVEKYCSVAESLDPKIVITHSFEVHLNQGQ